MRKSRVGESRTGGGISFVTTESVATGTPLSLSIIVDEALPYYSGPFEPLDNWESDPKFYRGTVYGGWYGKLIAVARP